MDNPAIPRRQPMSKFLVTFKGPTYDISVAGDSVAEILKEYDEFRREFEQRLKPAIQKRRSPAQVVQVMVPKAASERKMLGDLSIPEIVKNHIVTERNRLNNWDIVLLLLHYSPDGLTNKQIRWLSEELGKRISYSWFDTAFHRRDDEGLVISRRLAGEREVLYLAAEPGKKLARELVNGLEKASDAKR